MCRTEEPSFPLSRFAPARSFDKATSPRRAPHAGGSLISDSRFWRSCRRPSLAAAPARRVDALRQALEVGAGGRQDDGAATALARVDVAFVDLGVEGRTGKRIA